ncbi:MAG: hypothetical protein DMF57_00855 [Acidobacteria bacterium]|nr:MAG: hypothetical protein DMF57_00855 [Acidobacteriota bacterium]
MFARRVLRPMLTLAVLFLATQAPAQVARVFLSGTGDDLNDCTNAATPCRSLQGAVNQCPVKGEIIITTSGGFGTATISKSLTVNAPSGVVAFNARTITVSLGYGDLVVIRGLSMNGAVFADSYGIDFQGNGGVLVVENSIIAGFGVGINSAFSRTVHNCELRNNTTSGIASRGGASLMIENSRFENNGQYGLDVAIGNGIVRNSVSTGNGTADYNVRTTTAVNLPSNVIFDRCIATKSASGIRVEQVGQAAASVRVTNSTISDNTTGLTYVGAGTITSYGTNHLRNNGTNGTFSSTVARN